MSAVYFKLITVLCLSGTALSGPGSSAAVWRDFGGAVTIQCRSSETDQTSLDLRRGLNEMSVLFKDGSSDKYISGKELSGRIQLNGEFPNMDILIENLTSDDTGPYWCIYTRFDQESSSSVKVKGLGSLLLVVTDRCDPPNNHLTLVAVVICAAALMAIIIVSLIWRILKAKRPLQAKRPQRVATNDVYEEMRATLRR
ncbi:hypothetical protein EYF80_020475 [Liparis tanakae]|uniref:Immunoglobulin domain-containing protein n=1 Tax=Liparis tanakae TaxID=230148 RepID=A0A4Z2HWE3_9TELE|nr:hypothetical protein EYF80_020475 [Liparis tanakae]